MSTQITKKTKHIANAFIQLYNYRNRWYVTATCSSPRQNDPDIELFTSKSIECCGEEEGELIFDSMVTLSDVISFIFNEKHNKKDKLHFCLNFEYMTIN